MKTITPEIKICITALYYGQKIMQTTIKHDPNNLSGLLWVEPMAFKEEGSQYFLNVTPLSKITDEDAIMVAKMRWGNDVEIFEIHKLSNGVKFFIKQPHILGRGYKGIYLHRLFLEEADYLRSRGYAMPAMGYTVDELIEAGVFRIKEEKE